MDPFITNEELFTRIDSRWVSKNLMDDGTAPSLSQMTTVGSPSYLRLQDLILDASELLMAAASVGARYTVDEVRTYGGNLLKRIVAGLSIGPILQRRMRAVSDEDGLNASYTEAVNYVEALRRGERIFFAVPLVPEAGLPGHPTMLPGPGNPPLLTQAAGRYFGCPAANNGPGGFGLNPYYPTGDSNPNN